MSYPSPLTSLLIQLCFFIKKTIKNGKKATRDPQLVNMQRIMTTECSDINGTSISYNILLKLRDHCERGGRKNQSLNDYKENTQ